MKLGPVDYILLSREGKSMKQSGVGNGATRLTWHFRHDYYGGKFSLSYYTHNRFAAVWWPWGVGRPTAEYLLSILPEEEQALAMACSIRRDVPTETVYFINGEPSQ